MHRDVLPHELVDDLAVDRFVFEEQLGQPIEVVPMLGQWRGGTASTVLVLLPFLLRAGLPITYLAS